MSVRPIYRWSGQYFGFIKNELFYDSYGNYLGWLDKKNEVYRSNGDFLGELVDDCYVLRKVAALHM